MIRRWLTLICVLMFIRAYAHGSAVPELLDTLVERCAVALRVVVESTAAEPQPSTPRPASRISPNDRQAEVRQQIDDATAELIRLANEWMIAPKSTPARSR